MAYSASPRPTFERAAHIPYDSVARHLWGDAASGQVADWIYVSNEHIHHIVFALPPRGWFRHSDSYRTIFGADVTYTVLSGVMVLANPQTGEVHRVLAGETAFFRRDTWHHAFNYSDEPLRVCEFFSPPPSTGTSGVYARQQPYLNESDSKYTRDEWLGQLPMQAEAMQATNTIRVIRDTDLAWRLAGCQNPVLTGLIVATEHLTLGKLHLLPGQHGDAETHGGDESIYVLEGTLNVQINDGQRPNWFEVKAGDACYIPTGVAHEYWNITGQPVKALFGVAPKYLSEQK